MIEGASLVPLRQIGDERGKVMHMLRSDAPFYKGFGEIYFSTVNPGFVKAWHLQLATIRHYAVLAGTARVVLYDDRDGSATSAAVNEFVLGEDNYHLLVIPSGVWSGFAAIGDQRALIADCTTRPHDPADVRRRDSLDPTIPYRWDMTR
jgi:dTDP-4-dehydrorhamnose 3,5-epimerase